MCVSETIESSIVLFRDSRSSSAFSTVDSMTPDVLHEFDDFLRREYTFFVEDKATTSGNQSAYLYNCR